MTLGQMIDKIEGIDELSNATKDFIVQMVENYVFERKFQLIQIVSAIILEENIDTIAEKAILKCCTNELNRCRCRASNIIQFPVQRS